jgi:arsenate reductase
MQFIYYPKCSTCIKALKHLEQKNLSFTKRDIVLDTPTQEELKQWIENYGQGIKPFFNTAGQVYRSLGLKEKINDLTLEEAAKLLASNGMLIKRPLLIEDNQIIIGYKKEAYEQL